MAYRDSFHIDASVSTVFDFFRDPDNFSLAKLEWIPRGLGLTTWPLGGALFRSIVDSPTAVDRYAQHL